MCVSAGCGEWIKGSDFIGNDILGESRLAVSHDNCREVCASVPACNAVTFWPHDQHCWVKAIPEGEVPIVNYLGDTLRLCADETGVLRCAALRCAGLCCAVPCRDVSCCAALRWACLLYTSPSPRDRQKSRMPSSA